MKLTGEELLILIWYLLKLNGCKSFVPTFPISKSILTHLMQKIWSEYNWKNTKNWKTRLSSMQNWIEYGIFVMM